MNALRIACTAAIPFLSACSLLGSGRLADDTPGVIAPGALSPFAAQTGVRAGSSTQAQVKAALGAATVVRFDSGWEVWVYRWPGADRSTEAATEFVILFDPSGTARKTRVRIPPPRS